MSGVIYGSMASMRQHPKVNEPKELCEMLGGDRVITKVSSIE